jgi:hypothetical protein
LAIFLWFATDAMHIVRVHKSSEVRSAIGYMWRLIVSLAR